MGNSTHLPYQDKPEEWSSHSTIKKWIRDLPSGSTVLDIGTASGSMARICADIPLHWRGIEPNEKWGGIARPFYQEFLISDIESAPKTFVSNVDAIILADVLEHLPNPDVILKQLVQIQNDQTVFYISVPNIANIYVRINLLVGKFDYSERGILDFTHLRFFTYKSLKQLINASGLDVVKTQTTPIPLALIFPFFLKSTTGKFAYQAFSRLSGMFPTILGYQFVVKAQKRVSEESYGS